LARTSNEKIPVNVRNVRPMIGGFDARKISSLILVLMLSLLIMHFNTFVSVIFALAGCIFSLVPSEDGFFPGTLLRRLRSGIIRKSGKVKLSYNIDTDGGVCIFRTWGRMFVIAILEGIPAQMLSSDETQSAPALISSVIDKLSSSTSFVAFNETPDVARFTIQGDDDDSSDYNGLISYIFDGVKYYKSCLILSADGGREFSSNLNLLMGDCQTLSDGVRRAGLDLTFVSDVSEARKILKESL
jgi:hypothetical protein